MRSPQAAGPSVSDSFASLNEEQARAARYGIATEGAAGGPLLIIAGAGSGKTQTLAHRVAHLIEQGFDPNRMLLLTFSRRAAQEMERRAERILAARGIGQGRASIGWSGTFHAIGARLLREFAQLIGLDPAFTIHDREDSADLMNLVRHHLGFSEQEQRFPLKAACLAIYSRAVNSGHPLSLVLQRHFPWCVSFEDDLRRLFEAYVEAKQSQHVLDYDDLLLYWAELMKVPELARDVSGLFDHVLVDEYQDTNAIQAAILLALKPDGKGLTVVGDDAQSIYGFRAATVRNILDFPNQFDPPAAIITLVRNYRSTVPILTAANAVIALAKERFTKNLWSDRSSAQKPALVAVQDDAAQAQFVVERVLATREASVPLKEQAVLFRTGHHSAVLEIELSRRNIPFMKFGGLKFLEAAHVKDLLAVLRWAENALDRMSGFRVLQLLPGVGPGTAGRLLDQLAGRSALQLLSSFPPPARAAEDWPALALLMRQLWTKTADWPSEIDLVRRWLEPYLEQRYADALVRAGDLEQLAQIAASCPGRQEFLTGLTLDPPQAASDEAGKPLLDEDYLILSTIHSAKGQEWKAVYILNVVDGCMPSDLATGTAEEIEEERRLLYVAMTRAKDELTLIVPQRFYTHQQPRGGDRHVFAGRSRFIPANLTGQFARFSWPIASGRKTAAVAASAPVDIQERLRLKWSKAS
ncbi:MAG: ATP-dependent helicase [Rhodomicrobium sp.]